MASRHLWIPLSAFLFAPFVCLLTLWKITKACSQSPVANIALKLDHPQVRINEHLTYLSFQNQCSWYSASTLVSTLCNELSIFICSWRNPQFIPSVYILTHRPFLSPVMSLSLLLRRRDSMSGIQGMSSSLGTSSTWSRLARARPQFLCCIKNWQHEMQIIYVNDVLSSSTLALSLSSIIFLSLSDNSLMSMAK